MTTTTDSIEFVEADAGAMSTEDFVPSAIHWSSAGGFEALGGPNDLSKGGIIVLDEEGVDPFEDVIPEGLQFGDL